MARHPVINQALEMVVDRLFRLSFWTARHLDPDPAAADDIDLPELFATREPADTGLVHFAGESFTFSHPDGRIELRQRCGWCGHELLGLTFVDPDAAAEIKALPRRARVINLAGIWWAAASGSFHDLPQRCIDTEDVLKHAWETQ